jgi:hypothetical protein
MISVLVGLARWRWLLPLTWGLAVWWALVTDGSLVQGRFLNAAVQGVQSIMFIAPAVALAGVLAGAAERHNPRRTTTASRHQASLALGVTAVHTLIATSAVTLSVVMISLDGDVSGTDGWQLVALAGLTIAGTSLVGQALGRLLPEVVAAPVAVLGSYVLLAFPRSLSRPLWVRHLVFVDSCCNSPEQVSPQVLVAMAVTAGGVVAAGALLTIRGFRGLPGIAAAAATTALTLGAGAGLVEHLGWSPATTRTGAVQCAEAGDGEVCVWPENAEALPELSAVWARLRTTATEHGLDLPETVTEKADGDVVYGDGLISLTPQTSRERYAQVLVTGALPAVERCWVDGTLDVDLDNAWLTSARWWISTSGFTHSDDLNQPFADLLDVPAPALGERVDLLVSAVRSCDPGSVP